MSHYSTVQCKVQTAQMSPLTVIFPAVMVAFVFFPLLVLCYFTGTLFPLPVNETF